MKTKLKCWTAFLAAAVAVSCLAGCKTNKTVDDTTPPIGSNNTDPAPPASSPGLGSQKSIIAALEAVPVERMGMREVENDRVRVYYNGELITPSLRTSESSGSQNLIPIRMFYSGLDAHNGTETVVYWVAAKRRVLVAKRPIPEPIIVIDNTGYAYASTISRMNNWKLLAGTEMVEFSTIE